MITIPVAIKTVRQANWAMRLRAVFPSDGSKAGDLFTVADIFAMRERQSELLGDPMNTDNADMLLMYRPWESEAGETRYEEAMRAAGMGDYLWDAEDN